MLVLLSSALAFDQCPDPPRPHITDLAVKCEQDELSVRIEVYDDGSLVDKAHLEIWTPYGQVIGVRDLVYDGPTEEGRLAFKSPQPEEFACNESWLLRAVATNVAGQTGQRDRWLNTPIAVQNGGFEEDLWSWGVGGNAEVAWKQQGASPVDPYQGNAMLELGWPTNGYYTYGYAWQNLGELPAGSYQLDFQYAIANDLHYMYTDESCADVGAFFFGFNSYTDDDTMDNYASDEWDLIDQCSNLEVTDWWGLSLDPDDGDRWLSESVTFDVPSGRSDEPTFLWFNHYGGYHYAQWVYIDEVYLTPPAEISMGHLAESILTEATYIGDLLSYPEEEPDYPNWFYWDHFEEEVNDTYVDLCWNGCAAMSGKYGPEKTGPGDDVDGVWGFDGSMLHLPDDSVLLIETKTTAGTCFQNDDEGLEAAEDYLENRRQASEKPLKKCDYEDCAQMSALWIEGTIKDLCEEEEDQRRLAARRIEEAWDDGTLYTTWAAVGFEPPAQSTDPEDECLTGWMLEAEPAPPKTRDEPLCPEELE